MKIQLEDILKAIHHPNPRDGLHALDQLSATWEDKLPKVHYIFDYFRRRFANLVFSELPDNLGEQLAATFFEMVRELINQNKNTFEECSQWKTYNDIEEKINKHFLENPPDPNGGW